MKIVIAPDSFKESLSAGEVAEAIATGLRDMWPEANLVRVPMADGGEGTVAAVVASTGGRRITTSVTGPMGGAVAASFGLLSDVNIAVLEMAAASGLELVPSAQRNPLIATSYGTGELLRAALDAGAQRCVVGIGGSATVDAGAGMLQALGAKLLDAHGKAIPRGGAALARLAHIDLTSRDRRLANCRIEVACDVDNPLTGPNGAAQVFAPQKGATPAMVSELEAALENFARVVRADLGCDIAAAPGAGAAGGMGAAFIACLNATMRPGVELIAELVGLAELVRDADLVITGEGRLDTQTLHGKTPIGVAAIAKRYGKPVIALAGSVDTSPGFADQLRTRGIDAAFSILPHLCTREEAYAEAAQNLRVTARNIAALWSLKNL